MKSIYILTLRQLKRYSRARMRILSSLGQPLLFLFAMGFGFGPTYQKAVGGSYIQFIAPGIIAMAILFNSVFAGIEIIWDKQFGFLKATLVAPISRFEIVLGRTIGGAIVAMIQGFVMFGVCYVVGFRVEHWSMFPLAILCMFLIAVFFSAMGTTLGSLLDDMQAFPLVMNFLVLPIFFFSGALFPLDNLPASLKMIIHLNPMTYGVDSLRCTLTHGMLFNLSVDCAVLVVLTSIMLAIGSYCFSKIQL